MYWPDDIEGACCAYWSSSPVADYDGSAWVVNFVYGGVGKYAFGSLLRVRCVR